MVKMLVFAGGMFRATRGLQKKHGENRCFDAPIAEASLVGIAAGMAFNGLRPIGELQFQGFCLFGVSTIILSYSSVS